MVVLGSNIPFQNFCCVITLNLASLLHFHHQFQAPYITIYRKRKKVSLHNLSPSNCVTTAQCLHIRMKSVWRKMVGFVTPHLPPSNATFTQCLLTEAKTIHQMHNSFMLTIRQQIINHKSGGEGGVYENAVTTSNKKHIPYYLIIAIMQDSPATKWSVS